MKATLANTSKLYLLLFLFFEIILTNKCILNIYIIFTVIK